MSSFPPLFLLFAPQLVSICRFILLSLLSCRCLYASSPCFSLAVLSATKFLFIYNPAPFPSPSVTVHYPTTVVLISPSTRFLFVSLYWPCYGAVKASTPLFLWYVAMPCAPTLFLYRTYHSLDQSGSRGFHDTYTLVEVLGHSYDAYVPELSQ